ncbi:uncharacterized protein BO80DRAFT_420743 [Aspergillus ibericus CBS 121593]|uniref:Transmembrane protein n=1 Tax=Aspergillus ibericus CBS 121593 TaxID=1448316 RepID=A0A395HH28_9EURO|nr:hypothetical protein BO80DRAFT_420743 [Aspergillus ibericus CBS 121593]RAL05544.1 hypothetical protein BO80DRAFT_420743 [Aspergillus ibericus CBS 121593]
MTGLVDDSINHVEIYIDDSKCWMSYARKCVYVWGCGVSCVFGRFFLLFVRSTLGNLWFSWEYAIESVLALIKNFAKKYIAFNVSACVW